MNRRNTLRLVARGARFVANDGYGLIVAVHASVFVLLPLEWAFAPWAGLHGDTWLLLGVYVVADAVRYWATFALGDRWSTRVVVLPDTPPVRSGPYRWLRHPIYVAVVVLLVALPLAFGLVASAAILGAVNFVAVRRRIALEEAAWRETSTPLPTRA